MSLMVFFDLHNDTYLLLLCFVCLDNERDANVSYPA